MAQHARMRYDMMLHAEPSSALHDELILQRECVCTQRARTRASLHKHRVHRGIVCARDLLWPTRPALGLSLLCVGAWH